MAITKQPGGDSRESFNALPDREEGRPDSRVRQ
jgi:hypothetical protein